MLNADGYDPETLFHPKHVINGENGYGARSSRKDQLAACRAIAEETRQAAAHKETNFARLPRGRE